MSPTNAAAPAGNRGGTVGDHLAEDQGQFTAPTDNRLSPDVDSERTVAGCLLWCLPEDAARVLARLSDDDLTDPLARAVVGIVRRMVPEGIPLSAITVAAYARRHALDVPNPGRHLLAELHSLASEAPPPSCLDYLTSIVVEQSARRRGAALAERLARIFRGADVAEVGPEVRRLVGEILDAADRLDREQVTA